MSSTKPTCSPKFFLDSFSKPFYNPDKIKLCFYEASADRETNLRVLSTSSQTVHINPPDHKFETIPDAYDIALEAFRSRTKLKRSQASFQTDVLNALFGITQNAVPVPLEEGNNAWRECIPYIQRKNLELILLHMGSKGIIAKKTLTALIAFLPRVNTFEDVRRMVDMACPGEIQMTSDLSIGRFVYDLTQILDPEPGPETPIKQRIRLAHLKISLESYAATAIVPNDYPLISYPFSTQHDVKVISEDIQKSTFLRGENTYSDVFNMFLGDMMDATGLRNLHQECYAQYCPRCPQMAAGAGCPDLKKLKAEMGSFALRKKAGFDTCIQRTFNREPKEYEAALLEKMEEYKRNGYIKLEMNSDDELLKRKLNSCEAVFDLARHFMSHSKIATVAPRKKLTEHVAKVCYNRFQDEFWLAVLDQNDRCFLEPSAMRQENLEKLIEKLKSEGIVLDWFRFNGNSRFETIEDAYDMAEAAYRAKTRQFTHLTHGNFLNAFLDAFFYTSGQSHIIESNENPKCYSSAVQGNLRQVISRYMELRTIPYRSILNELHYYVPEVRSFEDVYKMAEKACPDYVRRNTFNEPIEMIKYACAQASGLKRDMMKCHQIYCRATELRMHWTVEEWKSEMINCYERELGPQRTRVSREQLENDFDCCANAVSHKTPSQEKARAANLRRLLEFYMDRGMITRKMIDTQYGQDYQLPSTFEGVRHLAWRIYSYPSKNYKTQKWWRLFKNEIMPISQLPELYESCYRSVCKKTPSSEIVKCQDWDECAGKLEKYASARPYQRSDRIGSTKKQFDICVSNAVKKREKSTSFTCNLSVHYSNPICINLEKKLTKFWEQNFIGNDLRDEILLNSEKDVDNLAYALYASHSRLYPQ